MEKMIRCELGVRRSMVRGDQVKFYILVFQRVVRRGYYPTLSKK
jgi:hypothetical protein